MRKITPLLVITFLLISQAQSEEFVLGGATFNRWEKGTEVDIEGNIAVVSVPNGLPDQNVATIKRGFVYVYEFNGETWIQTDKLLSSIGDEQTDGFGNSVQISQERIIVGASKANREVNGANIVRAGSVYIYERVNGSWLQTNELVPSIVERDDQFGKQVTASANRIFVSKSDQDSLAGEAAGGVFVFEYINGRWVETDLITENEVLGRFTTLGNWGMDTYQDVLVVSSFYRDATSGGSTSDVYIYRLIENSWQFEQKITSPSGMPGDEFGFSPSVYGSHLLIGAPNENTESGVGSVYLYERIDNIWTQVRKFVNSNPVEQSQDFGLDVAMGNNQLVIGSRHQMYTQNGIDEGQVFIYNRNGENWQLVDILDAEGVNGHNDFGQKVALSHDRLIVGAPFSGSRRGAAYVYAIEPNSERLPINAGLNGTWYNPETSGQGLFLDISNALDFSFMGLFTYDVEMSSNDLSGQIGAEGQRWLVGAGEVNPSSSSINYSLYYTYDGLFDDPREVVVAETETYGSLIIEFQSCTRALVTYYLFESGISGSYPINRPVAESGELCAELAAENAAQIPSTDEFDYSLNGAWFNPDTSGQGFFIDKFKGVDTAFMGWFTYDTELPTSEDSSTVGALGQRWLVGAGAVDVTDASVLNFELYYTYGGLFDDPTEVTVFEPGSYGDLRIEFIDCAHANVEYSIDSEDLFGSFSMVRAVPNGASCNEVVE